MPTSSRFALSLIPVVLVGLSTTGCEEAASSVDSGIVWSRSEPAVLFAEFEDVPPPVEPPTQADLDDDGNAAGLLEQAASAYVPLPASLADAAAAAIDDASWTENGELERWLDANHEALSLLAEASTKATLAFPEYDTLDDVRHRTPLLPLLRELAWLPLIDGSRAWAHGEQATCWRRVRQSLRLSVLASTNARPADRHWGSELRLDVFDHLSRRMTDLDVDESRLLWLIEQVNAADRDTAPLSRAYEIEYGIVMRDLDRRAEEDESGATELEAEAEARLREFERDLVRGTFGFDEFEPELSRRVVRRLFTNWLADLDRPRRDRTPLISAHDSSDSSRGVDAFAVSNSIAITPEDSEVIDLLNWAVDRARIAHRVLPRVRLVLEGDTRAKARTVMTRVMLAAEIHRRRHGMYPKSIGEIRELLDEEPLDPFGRTASPIHYRREYDEVVMWSVGYDGDDDRAHVGWTSGPYGGDYIQRFGATDCEDW